MSEINKKYAEQNFHKEDFTREQKAIVNTEPHTKRSNVDEVGISAKERGLAIQQIIDILKGSKDIVVDVNETGNAIIVKLDEDLRIKEFPSNKLELTPLGEESYIFAPTEQNIIDTTKYIEVFVRFDNGSSHTSYSVIMQPTVNGETMVNYAVFGDGTNVGSVKVQTLANGSFIHWLSGIDLTGYTLKMFYRYLPQ